MGGISAEPLGNVPSVPGFSPVPGFAGTSDGVHSELQHDKPLLMA
jgi:hypothetical protein